MANVKISQLPSATTPLGGTEVLPIVQGTTTKKVTVNDLRATSVTAVTGTAPVVSSGGTTPAISMAAANGSTNGYLTSTDWTTFNGKYSVGGALGTPSSGTATNLTGLPLTTGVTGVLPVANGGNGTATPSLVAGSNVTITGTWPNQTIASTGGGGGGVTSFSAGTTGFTPSTATTGAVTLAGTLAVANGGTGTATPSLVAGTNITISGSFPNQTINASGGGGGGMVYPGAGIPLSTGTAWGTSYNTTGTGDVVLSTSPTLVTPLLGTPTSGDFRTGTFTWPTFNQNTTGTAANVTGTVAIANGGTGHTNRQDAIDTLVGAVTSGTYLRGNGTDVVMSAIQAADVPTLNQNTTGTAANVTGTVAIGNGGTGQTNRQDAIDALAGAVTSGTYLRGNGTDVVMAAIQAADVPTLNQNTTGTAANVTGTVAVANGGTGATSLTANNVLLGNGTSAVQVVAPGTTGNVLTSNGTTWVSSASAAGDVTLTGTQTFTNKTLAAATNTIEARSAPSATSFGFRNRIINGDMGIDQRNAGAAVTQSTSLQYTVDRFGVVGSVASKFTAQQSLLAATGFTNSLLCTSSSAYTVGASEDFSIRQSIEGLNVGDLAWGTASASSVTLSFWVRSSLTGTFGGSIANSAQDRFYVFSYTISAANTWEQKTITIAGDTTGTWLTTNGVGIRLLWSLGAGSTVSGSAGSWGTTFYRSATGAVSVVGTNGATLYITGVQLEAGTVATPFERIDYGRELMLCQRYFQQFADRHMGLTASNSQTYTGGVSLMTTMRATPTLAAGASFAVGTGSAGTPTLNQNATAATSSPTFAQIYNSDNNWVTATYVEFNGGLTSEL